MPKLLKLFSDCIPVKGNVKSIICDLTRGDIINIPNSMYEFLEAYEGKSLSFILNDFSSDDDKKIISEYINVLESHEVIFWCDESEFTLFPKMGKKWDYPKQLMNAIIEYNPIKTSKKVMYDLDVLGVEHYQFRLNLSSIKEINLFDTFIQEFSNNSKNLKTFEIVVLRYNEIIEKELKYRYINHISFLREVIFYESSQESTTTINEVQFVYKINEISAVGGKSVVTPNSFFCNLDFFTESLKHNTYFNRKICIDYEGNIKNSLSDVDSYGSINDSINEIVSAKNFKKLWYASKDKIDICNKCQYRYVCFDDRYLKFDKNKNIYYSDVNCNYDPIKGNWKN